MVVFPSLSNLNQSKLKVMVIIWSDKFSKDHSLEFVRFNIFSLSAHLAIVPRIDFQVVIIFTLA